MVSFDEQVPVTMIVTRSVKPGCASRFEQWLHEIAAEAMRFEGHQGVNVIRPGSRSREYTAIFRFQTPAQLDAWVGSAARARQLQRADVLCDEVGRIQKASGVEAWFVLSARLILAPPARYKMAILSASAVLPLLVILPRLAAPALNRLPELGRLALMAFAMTTLMTYLVMPLLTRIFSSWLYAERD
jgi:uncharacterized protein